MKRNPLSLLCVIQNIKFGHLGAALMEQDCDGCAEFLIELINTPAHFKFSSYVTVECGERTSLDVFNDYVVNGIFQYSKFIQDHGDLKFVARSINDDVVLPECYANLQVDSAEDFVSTYSDVENKAIQDKIIHLEKTYNCMLSLGLHKDCLYDLLNAEVDEEQYCDFTSEYEPFFNSIILLIEKPFIDISSLKLVSPTEIELSLYLSIPVVTTRSKLNLIINGLFSVDHANKTVSYAELKDTEILVSNFDTDEQDFVHYDITQWFFDYNSCLSGEAVDESVFNEQIFDAQLNKIAQSDSILQAIQKALF